MVSVPHPRHRTARYAARLVDDLAALGSDDLAAWKALEARAAEPNAYLSPHFVLPAARHLTPSQPPLVVFVERSSGDARELVGVGVFARCGGTRLRPVRRLVGYRSRHSFLGGLLLDRSCVDEALHALVDFVGTSMPRFKAVELPLVWSDGALVQCSGAALRRKLGARAVGHVERAVLAPADCEALLRDKSLAPRIRDLDRRRRRLAERGRVEWHAHRDAASIPAAVESFLALEHMGWKADAGSSLRSQPSDEAFFVEAVAGFASQGRALFTELRLDGVAIASTCSFMSGRIGFGFKIGWNPEYRKLSPALLNELELMRQAPALFGDIDYFDSGSSPSSYINELWLTRRALTTLVMPTGLLGACSLYLADCARAMRRRTNDAGVAITTLQAMRPELVNVAEQGVFGLASR